MFSPSNSRYVRRRLLRLFSVQVAGAKYRELLTTIHGHKILRKSHNKKQGSLFNPCTFCFKEVTLTPQCVIPRRILLPAPWVCCEHPICDADEDVRATFCLMIGIAISRSPCTLTAQPPRRVLWMEHSHSTAHCSQERWSRKIEKPTDSLLGDMVRL